MYKLSIINSSLIYGVLTIVYILINIVIMMMLPLYITNEQ